MRLTQHVTRIAAGLVLGGVGLSPQSSVSAGKQVLDLTKVPSEQRRSMGVPGGSMGGVAGGATDNHMSGADFSLPLKVKIASIQEVPNSEKSVLTLELVNAGAAVVEIPSCVDPYTAFVAGARHRRSLNFGLMVEKLGSDRTAEDFVEVTSGSDSVSSCLLPVAPGKALVVVMNVVLPNSAGKEPEGEKKRSIIRAFVEEWEFEDAEYLIRAKSNRVESPPQTLQR